MMTKIPFAQMLDHLTAGILFADPRNTIVYCNAAEQRLRQASGGYLLGRSLLDCHPAPARARVEALCESFRRRENAGIVRMNECHAQFIEQWLIPVYGRRGAFLGTMLVSLDVTTRESARRLFERQAIGDELTGLFNRNHFLTVLKDYGRQLGQSLSGLVLLMADVNGMKAVNDQLGHEAGDRLLRKAAEVLRGAVRAHDPVFRIGGDEFVVLLPGGDGRVAAGVVRRIKRVCRRWTEAHPELPLSIAAGWSVARTPAEAESLYVTADQAMYREKQREKAQLTSPR
jgi:diguanylate cyclase (GGDEF)-like protein